MLRRIPLFECKSIYLTGEELAVYSVAITWPFVMSEAIAVELIEVKVFWVVESDNCLTRSKLCRGELRSSIYREVPTHRRWVFPAPLIT